MHDSDLKPTMQVFLRGTGCSSVVDAISSGIRTHDQWLSMLESYDNLERQVRAKLKRETCALQNVERLDGARYQVLRQLQVGGQTYPQLHNALTLSASSTHKAVEGLLKLAHIRHEGNLKSRKHRAIFYLTETGLQLLEQTKNFVHSSQVN